MLRKLIQSLAHRLFGDYQLYRIYSRELGNCPPAVQKGDYQYARITAEKLTASPDPMIRQQSWYLGADCDAFGCLRQGRIVALCFFWHGTRYRTERNFWPLAEDEAKLVQIVTLPEERGRGLAGGLIAHGEQEMRALGYRRLFARIWHSNTPSIKAFERKGWLWVTTIVVVQPPLIGRPLRIKLHPRR